MALRDTVPLIIHIDGDTIRAGRGLAELYEVPTVTLKACYGLRQASPTFSSFPSSDPSSSTSPATGQTIPVARPLSDYIVGQSLLDLIQKEGENAVEVKWPFEVSENAQRGKGKGREIDWRGREAILNYVFYNAFHLPPTKNLTTLLLIPPASDVLSPTALSTYTQLAFESLNVPALHILDPALAALYGVNSISGLAVMIGRSETVIDVVWEGQVKEEARVMVDVGKEDCVLHLVQLLLRDASVREQVTGFGIETEGESRWNARKEALESRAFRQLAESILEHGNVKEGKVVDVPLAGGGVAALATADDEEEDGVFNVAKVLIQTDASKSIQQLKDSKSKKSAAQQAADAAKAEAVAQAAAQASRVEAAADIYAFEVPSLSGKKVRVGPIRHRACEPIYREGNVVRPGKQGRTVQEGMAAAVSGSGKEYRQALWDSIVFTGDLARIPSLQFAIVSHLTPYLVSAPERETEYQSARTMLKKMPDYYVNFRSNATDLAPFLGASISAKIVFTDGRDQNCITKHMYNQYGPSAGTMAVALE